MKRILIYSFLFFAFLSCKKNEQSKVSLIQPEALAKIMTQKNIQLVDVRTKAEYDKGALKDATLIDFYGKDFVKKVSEKFDKKAPIYIYCQRGGRSSKAASMLKESGFQNVFDLEGGYANWNKK